ncbi:hypothetical protein MBLNU457_g0133t1 [Dothideomycetes sp. NU457]
MSSYERYDATRRRNVAGRTGRSALGYWIPLAITVTIATAGLVAWIWSEREGDDDDDYDRDDHGQSKTGQAESIYSGRPDTEEMREADSADEGLVARMSGAIRRTPSPQQFFDNAGRMASAAGAAVGLGTSSSRNDRGRRAARSEREEGFSDHERWSEEAVTQRIEEHTTTERSRGKSRAKRTVAIVLSAEGSLSRLESDDDAYQTEHTSILSHLPEQISPETTNLFILIYAPHLTSLPSIENDASPDPDDDSSFSVLYHQALPLVSQPEMVLPFTTPTGYIHILRHLAPETVYVSDQAALVGDAGRHISDLKGWVGQVAVVVGDDGTGGLVDTETETEGETDTRTSGRGRRKGEQWYESSEIVGLGKGVEVVDIRRVGEDWGRRVEGRA